MVHKQQFVLLFLNEWQQKVAMFPASCNGREGSFHSTPEKGQLLLSWTTPKTEESVVVNNQGSVCEVSEVICDLTLSLSSKPYIESVLPPSCPRLETIDKLVSH